MELDSVRVRNGERHKGTDVQSRSDIVASIGLIALGHSKMLKGSDRDDQLELVRDLGLNGSRGLGAEGDNDIIVDLGVLDDTSITDVVVGNIVAMTSMKAERSVLKTVDGEGLAMELVALLGLDVVVRVVAVGVLKRDDDHIRVELKR